MIKLEKLTQLRLNPSRKNYEWLCSEVERNIEELKRVKGEVGDICGIVDTRNQTVAELEKTKRDLMIENDRLVQLYETTRTARLRSEACLVEAIDTMARLEKKRPVLGPESSAWLGRVARAAMKREEGHCRSKTHHDVLFLLGAVAYLKGGKSEIERDVPWPSFDSDDNLRGDACSGGDETIGTDGDL